MTAGVSRIDTTFRQLLLFSKFFTDSWGRPDTLRQLLHHRNTAMGQEGVITDMLDSVQGIDMVINREEVRGGMRLVEGFFLSPHAVWYPNQLEEGNKRAHFQGIFPANKPPGALAIHMAVTGDHSYARRRLLIANELLTKHSISSIMLQNPFYGERKPSDQFRSSLRNVSDLFVMGAALIAECNWLLRWAHRRGYGPLCLSGVSMGGHMASLSAGSAPVPIAVVPLLSWTTAAPVYTFGALSEAVQWAVLEKELSSREWAEAVRDIPQCEWLDEMHENNKKNGWGLAKNLMFILMDEFTHLKNYPVPADTELCHSIVAENDGYVVREGATALQELWPGCRVDVIPNCGHVDGYLTSHPLFRETIRSRLERTQHKHY